MQYPGILVASNNKELGGILNRVFHYRCRLIQTASGLEAVMLAQSEKPDLIFVAEGLRDTTGFEVMKALRMYLPRVPVVYMCAHPEDTAMKAFRNGAKDVISQDVTDLIISDTLERLRMSGALHFGRSGETAPGDRSEPSSAGTPEMHLMYRSLWILWQQIRDRFNRAMALLFQRFRVPTDLPQDSAAPPKSRKLFRRKKTRPAHSNRLLLEAFYFGNFRIVINGKEVERFACHKGREILAYLLLTPGYSALRDELMEKFWPDFSTQQARNSLNVALHKVRKMLNGVAPGVPFIEFKDERYQIHPDIEVHSDLERFLNHLKIARELEFQHKIEEMLREYRLATECYAGDFMEECLYEEWTTEYREQYRELYLQALEKLSHYYCMNGKPRTAITLTERILRKDNSREPAHRRLMFCYWRLNQRDRAIKQFQKCAEVLSRELNVEPSETTRKLFEMIKFDQYDPNKTKEYLESKELSDF